MSPITDRHKIKVTDFGILVRIRWHIQWICHQRCAAAAQAARASLMMSLAFGILALSSSFGCLHVCDDDDRPPKKRKRRASSNLKVEIRI